MVAKVPLPKTSALLLLVAATVALLVWLERSPRSPATVPLRSTQTNASPAPTAPLSPDRPVATVAAAPLAAPAAMDPTSTRREIVEYLVALYRKEQLTRELDLEQRRYRAAYWQSNRIGPDLARLHAERDALIQQLTTEANAVLATELPGDTGEPIQLNALFDDNHPGPNISYLSPASRQAFEAAILGAGSVSSEQLFDLAAQTLSPAELVSYRQWNDPAVVALRNELVGFEANESEFLAILHRNRDSDGSDDATLTGSDLAAHLGPERYAELVRLKDPALYTAVHDLARVGLPLNYANWLTSTRQQASAAVQQIWQDASIPNYLKPERVAAVEHAYGQSIATKLGLRNSTLDELGSPQ